MAYDLDGDEFRSSHRGFAYFQPHLGQPTMLSVIHQTREAHNRDDKLKRLVLPLTCFCKT